MTATLERPSQSEADAVQWQVLEGGLRAAAQGLPRLEPALREALSDYATRFDAEVRRIRDACGTAAASAS
jgi:hypothetical protein